MAKKSSGKIIQMLSPENYIRTKARTLPLYECWVNADWAKSKLASCIVSRKHSNGNISFCFYLVDLYCLGLKSTHFVFNVSSTEYGNTLAEAGEQVALELVDYALVHNIIEAGIEYAEEYEFKPDKDFTKVTQYFLEADTEDIEFMEIECGDEQGQPFYIYSKTISTSQQINRTIAQLERTAGPNNYSFIDEEDMIDDEDDEDDFDDQEDIYAQNTFEENKEIFIDLYNGLEDSDDPNDLNRLNKVTDSLFQKITDTILVDQYYDEFFDNHTIPVEIDEFPNELLGMNSEAKVDNKLKLLFMDIYSSIYGNLKKARKKFELFRIKAGGIPAVAFLELLILQKEGSNKYDETVQKYAKTYPDYSLITLIWLTDIYSSENVPEEITNKTFNLDTLFPGRDSLHFLEMFYYLLFLSNAVAYEGNVNKMEAFYQVLDEFDLPEEIFRIVESLFSFSRIEYFIDYFNLEIEP